MIVLYLCIVFSTAVQSVTTKLYSKKNDDVILFNAIKSLSALLIFIIMIFAGFSVHFPTMLYGLLYGIMMCVSMYCGYMALAIGPMALTSMIVSFSVAMPILFGVTFCREKLNMFNIVGFVFLIAAVVLAYFKSGKRSDNKLISNKWTLYVLLTFMSNGFCSIIQKLHQINNKSAYYTEFMLSAMLVCSVFFIIFSLNRMNLSKMVKSNGKMYAVVSGLANAIAGYLTIMLAGAENASVLFPAISAGTLIASLVCGILIFKEKLKYNHIVSIIFGISAVIFLKI